MFARIRVETNYCGEWNEGIYEFPDGTPINHIEDYASELADENAMTFGSLGEPEFDNEEDEDYREAYSEWEILDQTREEILEEWGEILQA